MDILLFSFISLLIHCNVYCQSELPSICPNGWTRDDNSCYLFGHGELMPFVEAAHFCQQHHADLIQIETKAESLFVKDELMRFPDTVYWLGMTDEMVENVWRLYATDRQADFFDWYPNEPNGLVDRGDEDCAALFPPKYQWDDYSCTGKHRPLCEMHVSNAEVIVG